MPINKIKKTLTYAKAIFGKPEIDAVIRSLKNGQLSCGPETILFEKEFAKWHKIKYALSTNSGTSADLIAVKSLKIEKGSEVITHAGGTFPSTISPLIFTGLKPVFVDVKGLTIDANKIEEAITKKTRAIVFAHTLGFMPDMKKIMEISRKYNLKVIEDTCDAIGSKQNGKLAGTFGDASSFSFFPAHHMTTGEGGMFMTKRPELYREAVAFRDWGRDCMCRSDFPSPRCYDRWKIKNFDHRYYYTRIGLNLKMNEMTAAFGREQIKRLKYFIKLRKRNYKILANILNNSFNPEISPFAYPVYSKDKIRESKYLESKGINTRTIFAGNILKHPAYSKIDCRIIGKLLNSNNIFKNYYFVGIGPHLSIKDIHFIGETIKKFRQKH